MGKNQNGDRAMETVDPSTGEVKKARKLESVSGKWAVGLRDGDTARGHYLGFDWVVGRGGKPKKRHVFAEGACHNAAGEEIAFAPPLCIFGASALDNALKEIPLGVYTEVKRLGRMPNQQRISFDVAIDREDRVKDRAALIGRPEGPQGPANGYPDNWTGPRA